MTPLEVIEKFKANNPRYNSKRMGYAGRLDPMAEGVLLVLVGEENKKIGQYMGFDKEYIAEILLGFSSDSNDVLGVASEGSNSLSLTLPLSLKEGIGSGNGFSNATQDKTGKTEKSGNNFEEDRDIKTNSEFEKDLKKKLKSFVGKYEQKIPKYSSYKIKGKPMFHYARKGMKVEDVKKNVLIKKVRVNSIYQITNARLLKYIVDKVGKVNGDFRQVEILERWDSLLKEDKKYYVVNVTIGCSSGTYIRAIADDFGEQIGSGGILLSLKRTKVGKFNIKDSKKIT